MRRELWNVILMGVCFALTLTAYQVRRSCLPSFLFLVSSRSARGSWFSLSMSS